MPQLSPRLCLALITAFWLIACEEGPISSQGNPDAAMGSDAADQDAGKPDSGSDRDAHAAPEASTADASSSEPPPCKSQAPSACEEPAPTYADVEPLIETHCLGCHWGEVGGPWPLTTYNHVAAWTMEIRATMLDCSMPPADAEQDAMPLEDRQALLMWLRCGASE